MSDIVPLPMVIDGTVDKSTRKTCRFCAEYVIPGRHAEIINSAKYTPKYQNSEWYDQFEMELRYLQESIVEFSEEPESFTERNIEHVRQYIAMPLLKSILNIDAELAMMRTVLVQFYKAHEKNSIRPPQKYVALWFKSLAIIELKYYLWKEEK